MVLPNSFVLAEDAKCRQSLLLREAEILRLHRAAFLRPAGRPVRLRRQIGDLLIAIGKWIRGGDEQAVAGHRHTPASA